MSGALLPKYLEADYPLSGARGDSSIPHAYGAKAPGAPPHPAIEWAQLPTRADHRTTYCEES